MLKYLVAEDFDLTPALRNHVEAQVATVHKHTSGEARVAVNLKKLAHDVFSARMQVRYLQHDLFAESSGADLYQNIHEATQILIRQIEDLKGKRLPSRKRLRRQRRSMARAG